jgi:hypothetical protein
MSKKDPLIDCISKMDGSEKRYFSIFATRHAQENEGKKYLTIFSQIDKNPGITFLQLKELLKKEGVATSYLKADCNYLYGLIMQSLNQFHHRKSYSIRIKNLTISAELLFYKGMFDHAYKRLQKAEKLALDVENFPILLDVLYWQKRCLGYSKGFQKASEVNLKISDTITQLDTLQEITNLYYQSYKLHIDKDKTDTGETARSFEQLFSHPALKSDKSISSFSTRIYFHLIQAHRFYAENDNAKELDSLKKIEIIFETFSAYKNEHPLDFISIMDRLLNLKKFLDPAGFFENLKDLRKNNFITNYQKSILEQRIFLITNIHEIEYYLINHEYETALKKAQDSEILFSKNNIEIEPFYMIHLYYVCALAHFVNGKFDQCLDLINYVLNDFSLADRPSVYCKIEILNLLTHFELKNGQILMSIAKNIQRKYFNKIMLLPVEKELVKVFSSYRENTTSKFKSKLLKIYAAYKSDDSQNVFSKQYVLDNYLLWMQKHT